MKVMVYEDAKKLSVAQVENFSLRPDQLRIETICSGISHGTEMGIYRGKAPFFQKKMNEMGLFVDATEQETWQYPIKSCDEGVWYMGYANVGRVIEVGSEIKGLKVGDVVCSPSPHQSQVVTVEKECIKLPEGIKPEWGVFITNLITAFNGIMDAHITLGDTVVISGLGVLGQMAAQMARMSGAHKVYGVDVIEKRLEVAKAEGCDEVFNAAKVEDVAMEIRKRTGGRGADVVIEVSGNPRALNEAIRIAAPDTSVVALGWYQDNLNAVNLAGEFHHNRIGIKQSHTTNLDPIFRTRWDRDRRWATCVEILKGLKLDRLITQKFSFDDVAQAYEMVDQHPEDIIQVILTY